MSLNKKNKADISRAIKRLSHIILALEKSHGDFAATELLEVAIGLLERQIEMDIEFIIEDDDSLDNNRFLYLEEGEASSDFMLTPKTLKPLEELRYINSEDNEPLDLSDVNFAFLDESDNENIPTANELNEWFNLDYPG
jgi:replicative superfamily II helicase